MSKNKKIIFIICIIIGICSISVGSVAYYRIVVEGKITGSTGNAVFVLKDENSNVWNNKVIDLGKINPGDSGEFTITMDASGSSVDMYATLEIERTNLPTNLKFYTTSDHKSELHKYYSFLEKSGTTSETLKVYWYWNPYLDDEEDNKFINVNNLEANVKVSAVQISEYAVMKNGNSVTSTDRSYFWKDDYRQYIRTITFGNDLSNLPSSCTEENLCFDVTETGSKRKVYGYLVDSGLKDSADTTKSLYNLYIVSEAPIFAPTNCSLFFAGFNSLVNTNFNNNFNTSLVTNMSYMYILADNGNWDGIVVEDFYLTSSHSNARPELLNNNINNLKPELLLAIDEPSEPTELDLISLDLSHFNTSKVTNMECMFSFYSSLTSLNISNFNTSNVTNMVAMFESCSSLTNLDIGSFDTSKVTYMSYMFAGCSLLMNLDISSFNTSNVMGMNGMFAGCSKLTELNLNVFNTENVIYMNEMFDECSSLTELNLSDFNTKNVTDMSIMFGRCSKLTKLNLSSFNTSNVTNMLSMFYYCSELTELNLNGFNTSKVTDMSGMFYGCHKLTSLDLGSFNTSNVTTMQGMFSNCMSLKELNLSSFDTSSVTDMSYMFTLCFPLTTTINIMNANVTNYSNMFYNAATASGAKITVNYIADASTLVDNMIATKSSNSNVVKGSQI